MDPIALATVTSALTFLGTECAKGAASNAGKDIWSKTKSLLGWTKEPDAQELPKAIATRIHENEALLAELMKLLPEAMAPSSYVQITKSSIYNFSGSTVINYIGGGDRMSEASHPIPPGSIPPAPVSDSASRIESKRRLTDDDRRRNAITNCLKRMQKDGAATHVIIALDFCSFGAFGDFAVFELQAKLIKSIAHELQSRYADLEIVANSPGACKWQLVQFFSEEKWDTNCNKWKRENIPKFAKNKRAQETFSSDYLAHILSQDLTREEWIDYRLAFEKCVEEDYCKNNATVTRYPGIVPFHAWLCDISQGAAYGVLALCHHQTAATAELVFSIEGDGVRHTMKLAGKLFDAKKPPSGILEQSWDDLIP